jgi:hypothetical protein
MTGPIERIGAQTIGHDHPAGTATPHPASSRPHS